MREDVTYVIAETLLNLRQKMGQNAWKKSQNITGETRASPVAVIAVVMQGSR